jgi:hypothetical protein
MKDEKIKEICKKLRNKKVCVKTKDYTIIGRVYHIRKEQLQLFKYAFDTPLINYSEIKEIKVIKK